MCRKKALFRAEDPVARVAETGDDVTVFIEVFIHRTAVNVHIGVTLADALDALGCGNEVHETNIRATALLHAGPWRI